MCVIDLYSPFSSFHNVSKQNIFAIDTHISVNETKTKTKKKTTTAKI